jgi:hypothetical protein
MGSVREASRPAWYGHVAMSKLSIPRTLAVGAVVTACSIAAGAVALDGCQPCPSPDACYYELRSNPDGGPPLTGYRRQLPDGGESWTSEPCPEVPAGCPVA